MLSPFVSEAQLYGEHEIGLINDRDGFTFIRNGQEEEIENFKFLENQILEISSLIRDE